MLSVYFVNLLFKFCIGIFFQNLTPIFIFFYI
nr:MAG TPA: hypothetical protein [Caudoviricetes sp.]